MSLVWDLFTFIVIQTGMLFHKRTGTFGLGGAVTFLPEKFTHFRNARLLKSGYKRTRIARKTNSFTIYRVAENFSWEFNLDFGFFGFRGKKNGEFDFRLYSW